ncbi:MAG: sensor histidine kinase [Candidatus Promineifilaceae bacterium]
MEPLSTLQLIGFGTMLLSGMVAVSIGFLLIWQGPSERVNRLLFLWGWTIAIQQIVLVLNALSATFPLYSPATSSLMARLWVTLDHAEVALLFLSIVAYTQIGTVKQRYILYAGVACWFSYLFYQNNFNYHLDPYLMPGTVFNPFNGYPMLKLSGFPPNLFKQIVTFGGLIGMMTALPIITWRTHMTRHIRYASLIMSVSFVLGLFSISQMSSLNILLFILGYLVLAYAILDGNLFDPLRQANKALAERKQTLEKSFAWIEHQVFERTKALESAVAREHILSQELEQALAEAVRFNEMKSQIIETISHEFRTPLTKISTSTELLTKYGDRLKPEKQKQLQTQIEEAIIYITRLIESVLLIDTSAQSDTSIERTAVSMDALCESLEKRMRHTFATQTNLILSYQQADQRSVSVDSDLLGQVLQQLIDNARKFSAESESIYVQISLFDQCLRVSVTDTGIGITPEDMPHIWELLYRGGNIGTRRGLGVGLYAVRRIVRDMGGEISAESTPANTTFTLTVNGE